MVPKALLLKPESWRVARVDGLIQLVSESDGLPFYRESEERQVRILAGAGQWVRLMNHLEHVTGKLSNHVKADPRRRQDEQRMIEQTYALAAMTCVDHETMTRVLHTSRQLNLWREAA